MQGFKDLVVWQKAKDLAVQIYRISDRSVFESLDKECEQLGKMIGALIKARKDAFSL